MAFRKSILIQAHLYETPWFKKTLYKALCFFSLFKSNPSLGFFIFTVQQFSDTIDDVSPAEREDRGSTEPIQGLCRCGRRSEAERRQHGWDPKESERRELAEEETRRPSGPDVTCVNPFCCCWKEGIIMVDSIQFIHFRLFDQARAVHFSIPL